MVDRIGNWTVHDEDYLSDHKLISFNLNFNKPPCGLVRNFKKADWSNFKCLLAKKKWINPPNSWSKETIIIEADKLQKDITQALDKVCPAKKRSINIKSATWWTTELHNLMKKVKAIGTGSPYL